MCCASSLAQLRLRQWDASQVFDDMWTTASTCASSASCKPFVGIYMVSFIHIYMCVYSNTSLWVAMYPSWSTVGQTSTWLDSTFEQARILWHRNVNCFNVTNSQNELVITVVCQTYVVCSAQLFDVVAARFQAISCNLWQHFGLKDDSIRASFSVIWQDSWHCGFIKRN